jgi:deoxycytidylate deaminase
MSLPAAPAAAPAACVQVGACIVNDENIILSIGYNGFPRGCADSRLPWAKRAESGSILDTKYPYVSVCEANWWWHGCGVANVLTATCWK